MIVSPFTPLFFLGSHRTDGLPSDYVQTFSADDTILIEVIGSPDENPVGYVNEIRGDKTAIIFNEWAINSDKHLWFAALQLEPGIYSVYLNGIGTSEPFIVTDDEKALEETTLIQYSMKNNRQREDAVFFIDYQQYFFSFRVPGGFKDSGWSFGVDSEQFTTPVSDIAQLYGLESTQKKFTLGGNIGVPVWFGQMLNRILVCSYVYFDGVRYCRKESAVPEAEIQIEGTNSFVFSQQLQQAYTLDPDYVDPLEVYIRRAEAVTLRTIESGEPRLIE